MTLFYSHLRSIRRRWVVSALLMLVAGLSGGNSIAWGQTDYTCFPSCDEADARFLSVAGTGIQTLAGQTITMTLTSPGTASTLEIGFFDGETGGRWDVGSTPTIFTLYADPNADGTGTFKVGEWRGDSMPDNRWFNVTLPNTSLAKSVNGTHFYLMHIRAQDTATGSWSNFKLRTSGTINLRPNQSFNVTAPLPNLATAQLVFPLWPATDSTTYDGSWTFYLYVPTPTQSLIIWDGDMDHGSYDCAARDEDDLDTQNEDLPSWAPGTSAVKEGIASSTLRCINGDTATSNPTDDSQSPVLRREPSVIYEIIDPDGNYYANGNPSGNLEWEQFKISIAPFDREQMDYHADALPAGVYRVYMSGMDMQNLNAWRFGNAALGINSPYIVGVDENGMPVIPPPPVDPDTATIVGTLFFDQNSNGAKDGTEMPIDGIRVIASADFDKNGTIDRRDTVYTDENGTFAFGGLKKGSYKVSVDAPGVGNDATPTHDRDGIATPHAASFAIDSVNQDITANFGYKRTISGTLAGADTVMGSANTTFSVHNAPAGATFQWTVTGSGSIIGSTTGPSVTVNTSNFGSFTVSVKITHEGISTTLNRTVTVAGIDFALFAYEYLYFKGRSSSDTTRAIIHGNVGVNNGAHYCRPVPVLDLGGGCDPNGVYVADGYRVMADYVDLSGSNVSVYDLFANRSTSSTSRAKKRHNGPVGFTTPIIKGKDLPTIPSFSYGSQNITVQCGASLTLNPGKYGIITIKDDGKLTLKPGIYNIKSIRAGKRVRITTDVGSKVRIGRDLIMGDYGYVGPHNGALFIVRSDGVCDNYPSVDFGYRTEFHGQVFAPNGKIDLGKKTDLTGRFWGRIIVSDYDVNVTYYSPVTLLSRSNNDGFQKRLPAPTTGGAVNSSMSLSQNYPNPFSQSTTIAFSLGANADVTMRIIDMQGNVVRTLAENSSMTQGGHTIVWNGHNDNGAQLPSGTYFCRMESGDASEMIPLVLVRD